MTEDTLISFVLRHEAQHMDFAGLYLGRGLEQDTLGNTSLYHRVTCYVRDTTARLNILLDFINGESESHLVAKYGHYISREAPCWNN